jgi:lipoate---protein ligase
MKKKFRVIDTGSMNAALNMAIDEAMLEARHEGSSPDTIRFLSFDPHAALIGQFQAVDKELRPGYCKDMGIDINRRITGGGALYWNTSDVGWEIFSTRDAFPEVSKVEDYYRLFCSAIAAGINRFGIDCAFRPRNDIECGGKKISGSGGTSLGNAFMFQGTLLVDLDIDIMLRCLRVPIEKLSYSEVNSLKDRVTWLSREAGFLPERQEIVEKMLKGLREKLDIDTYPGDLNCREKQLLEEKTGFFESSRHIYRISQNRDQHYIKAITKSRKSVIKCSANIDMKRGQLKNLYFTGDFFVYPRRAVFDLEARLKNISIKDGCAPEVIDDFFENYPEPISGIDAGDIKDVVRDCFERTALKKYGIPLKFFNDIYMVHKPFSDKNKIEMLLLPYCAKLPECRFRYEQGCTRCGKCSIGDTMDMAEKYGLEHMTIVSYEHLHQTLVGLKDKGIRYYAGCCCEAFYNKHKQDFEKVGLPGILLNIDSTTCYDLGKEDDAYKGNFEGFTSIKLDLLEKVLKLMT